MTEETSKAERAKPIVVQIGNRQVISSGRWNDQLVADYVIEHGRDRWITIGELAKFAWTSPTLANKERARRYMGKLWRYLLVNRGVLMVVEGDPTHHNRTQALKIYDPASEQERQILEIRLDRMERLGELTNEMFELALNRLYPKKVEPPAHDAVEASR